MKVHEMMSKYMRIFLIAIASSITLSFFVESDTFFSQKEQVTLATIKKYLDRYHYNPPKLDSSYSSTVFDNYLKRLDPGRRILTRNDIEAWEQYRWTLAEEVEKSTFHFFDISYATWQRRLKESKEIFEQVIRDVPDFGHMDSLEMDGEKRTFPEDKEELKDAWCRYIKYDMLKRIDNLQERQKNKLELLDEPEEAYKTKIEEDGTERFDSAKWEKDKHFVSLGMDSLTVRAFDKSTSNYEAWFDRMEDTRRVDWMAQYLNALTNTIDPHTGFFKPKDKEDFDMRMSNQLEGIGAQLTKDGEYIKVVRLVPGGPAWEGGELKEDDVIIRVAQDGEEPVDILGMHMDDVISMIRGDKGTTVILTVKGIDGKIRDVAIERDVIIFEENYVKSAALIDSTTMDRVGYIRLPSFYANFDQADEDAILKLPSGWSRQLVLIFKEAFTNALKYSEASSVHMYFNVKSGSFWVEVSDNGKGFPEDQLQSLRGIKNMRERAAKLKAKLEIETRPGKGSKVRLKRKITQKGLVNVEAKY